MEFLYRKATIQDIDRLIELRLSLLKEVGEINDTTNISPFILATKNYLLQHLETESFVAFVALIENEIVSTSGISFFQRPPYLENLTGQEAYILNMYTTPPYRKRNLASHLLDLCLEECRSRGVKRIWLHPSEDGKHLYETKGFTYTNKEMEYLII